ncbi:FitA-like ribbon-helix-helix domain-containing protein [Candidatus Poriferisodalis sp.]|uniref:FitA-like ribbon-helix-helix domain-containing protein n=1 Tax=Candidatus Poriferisodalis sp. TaxID=3101277 RepID=UPI003C6FDAEF
MAVEITVYDVSENVRDRLAENAADRSQSLDDYLRQELERLAMTPSVKSLVEEVRRRKEASGASVSTSEILAARDADRA